MLDAADLVFVEYATNDGKVPHPVRTKAYERMLRKVRGGHHILLRGPKWKAGGGGGGACMMW